jgi:8-amino-7-oxononanoate synthase
MAAAQLAQELAQLDASGLRRQRRLLETQQGAHVTVDGRSYVSFCSNDYLGLAADDRLVTAAQAGAARYGVGSGASHLLTGHSTAHHVLEQALATFVALPGALLFSSGYMANIGIVTALAGRGGAVFCDKLNHASLNDAAVLSRARFQRYPHLDLTTLERMLARTAVRDKLIVTDAVFSMDGDVAPIPELTALAERFGAWLLVDDAHGFGVLGREGRGVLDHFGVHSPRIVYMATLGKSPGVYGAFAAADEIVIEHLVQRSRTYIYTTATPPLLAHTLLESLQIIAREDSRRERLRELVSELSETLALKRWHLLPSVTPIQPVVVGSNEAVLSASSRLAEKGFLVPAIRPPTVPRGQARLRISLSAAHTAADVRGLADALNNIETLD